MLGRAAKRTLYKHLRAISNSAVAKGVPNEQSIWSKVLNRSNMPRVPMSEALTSQGLVDPRPAPKAGIDVTTLSNGLRVASTESTMPITSVGVYTEVGSRYENETNNGMTSFLEKIAFKSNEEQDEFHIARQAFTSGANYTCSATRENIFYVGDSVPQYQQQTLETLANAIQKHKFNQLELNAAREVYLAELKDREKNMEQVMLDYVHEAAYHENTVGRPLYASAAKLETFNTQALKDFQRTFFNPKRMIVGGVGVDHQSFVEQVSRAFDELPATDHSPPNEKAKYTGGEIKIDRRRESDDSQNLTRLALAFESASWHDKDVVAMCVLQVLMGGGGSFSAGGPGKGMYSRLYRNVLNAHRFFESATCFNSIFADSALFGIVGVCAPQHATEMAEVLVTEFIRMAGEITPEELSRAKNQLRASVYYQLENRNLKLEDICRQLSVYGKVEPPQTVVGWVEDVTVADVLRVAQKMLKTPLTLAAYGDLRNVPRYDQIANAISSNISS